MDTRKLNPLRRAAKHLGLIGPGERSLHELPIQAYLHIYEALRAPARPILSSRFGDINAAMYVARRLLTRTPISAVTYICVSDYVGGTRYRLQGGCYQPTSAERTMLERIQEASSQCARYGYGFQWRLVLADGWGKHLYGDRVFKGALDEYCMFMQNLCEWHGLEAIRWTELMDEHEESYRRGREAIHNHALALAPWEAQKGEIAHDKPDPDKALKLAYEHIAMRAAEGRVVTEAFGPTLVLSTEAPKLTRYDNLLVDKDTYPLLYSMPFWPHRLSAADRNGKYKEIKKELAQPGLAHVINA